MRIKWRRRYPACQDAAPHKPQKQCAGFGEDAEYDYKYQVIIKINVIGTDTHWQMPVYRSDVSKSMSARQKLETQLTENNIVKEVSKWRVLLFWNQGFGPSNVL